MNNVLIIDADKVLRTNLVESCSRRSLEAVSVASAQAGIAACEHQKPDVIILELQLRGHSGVEFIHELRSYPEWQHIPIIIYTLTPWSHLEKFTNAIEAMGIVNYAYKADTSFQKLLNIIEDISLVKK